MGAQAHTKLDGERNKKEDEYSRNNLEAKEEERKFINKKRKIKGKEKK